VHETLVNDFEGITRVYALMNDAATALVPLGLALAIMPPRRPYLRTAGIVVFLIGAASTLFSFTRATYVGLMFAFLVTTILWMFRSSGARPVRRAIAVLCSLALCLLVVAGYRPLASSDGAISAASERATSTIQELQQRTGTVGYRYELEHQMLSILGGRWPVGLGFLHPDAHPVPGLPHDSIRNGDVGVLNSLMTMGALGTALLYAPLFGVLIAILRKRRDAERPGTAEEHEWFFYGVTMWIVLVLVTSISLVTLFSASGLALTALLLACAARLVDRGSTVDS
jgi:hypothetical protein